MEILNTTHHNTNFKTLLTLATLAVSCTIGTIYAKKYHDHLSRKEIVNLTLTEAKKALECGKLTSERYIEVLFDRIEKYSPKITDDPTKLNAFLFYNKEKALEQARESDRLRKECPCKARVLEGLPIAVKDFYDVVGMSTTLATAGIHNCIPSTNAEVVHALEHAGAIIIGKTNASEVGLMQHSANNTFAGITNNPYNLPYTTGGSSSGSACATAARLCPVALGTDFGGSIRWPGSCCGVLGYRPTQDRWSNAGTWPTAATDEIQNGPLCRSVEDAILLDSVLTNDWSKVRVKTHKLRIGVPREYFYDGVDPVIVAAIDATIVNLKNAGVTIVEQDMGGLALLNQIVNAWIILGNYQVLVLPTGEQATYNRWAADINNPFLPTTVANVDAQVTSPDAINAIAFLATLPTDAPTIAFFTDIRAQIIALANQYMDDNKLDAFLIPVSTILTPLNPNPTDATPYAVEVLSKAATVPLLKFPAINLPVGLDGNGLPIGADLVARHNDDRRLLYIAKELRPEFAPIPAPVL